MTFRKAKLMLALERNKFGLTESELTGLTETQLDATLQAMHVKDKDEFDQLCSEPCPVPFSRTA